jgi:hypothetical protein
MQYERTTASTVTQTSIVPSENCSFMPASLPPAQRKSPPNRYRRTMPSQKPMTGNNTPMASVINRESTTGIMAPNKNGAAKPVKGSDLDGPAEWLFKSRSRIEKIGRQTAVAHGSKNWRPIRTPQFKYTLRIECKEKARQACRGCKQAGGRNVHA